MRLRISLMSSRPVALDNQHWIGCDSLSGSIADEQKQWLIDSGSLTARLKKAFSGDFRVEVLFHDWDQPTAQERQFLDMAEDEQASIREVLLICNGEPMVFARSILPASSLEGKNKTLLTLKDKPLGEFLFAQPDLKRGLIEITQTSDRNGQTVWGRRSRFTLDNKPLAVCEYFLPALFTGNSEAIPPGVLSL